MKSGTRKGIGRISKINEQQAMNNLLNVVISLLEKHGTSLDEDNAMLNELPLYSTERSLVQLRRDEKIALMKIKDYCEKIMRELIS